jgi:hypothetical protein
MKGSQGLIELNNVGTIKEYQMAFRAVSVIHARGILRDLRKKR